MERDTPDKFSNFAGENVVSDYDQPTLNQPTNQPTNQLTNQLNQKPNYSLPITNQMSNYNQLNQQTNQINDPNDPNAIRNANQTQNFLSSEEVRILRKCTTQGFWALTLPGTIGFICYRMYNSSKYLKPLTGTTLLWQTMLFYFGTKLLWAPVCFSQLAALRGGSYIETNFGPYLDPKFKQKHPKLPQQQNNKEFVDENYDASGPYLNPKFQQQYPKLSQQQNNKEFVDHNYDASGYSKE